MQKSIPLAVIYVTASGKEEGEKIAGSLVEGKLVACCNVVQGVTSVYSWEGKINKDSEVLLIMKTRQSLIEKITQRVKELHSYSVPQVIAMPIIGGSQQYMDWVASSTLQEEN